MKRKAAVSFPMVVAVSIILLIIIIGLYYLFLQNTEGKLLGSASGMMDSVAMFVKGLTFGLL